MSALRYRIVRNNPGLKWEVRIQREGVSATVWDTVTNHLTNGSWQNGKRCNPDLGAPYWRSFRTGKRAVAELLNRIGPTAKVTKIRRHGWLVEVESV